MDEDENFIIDEEAAPVVKQIYNLCLAGNGPTKIARMLSLIHIWLYQIDLLSGSKERITEREYWAAKKGQLALDTVSYTHLNCHADGHRPKLSYALSGR